jgi:hypothetical protein
MMSLANLLAHQELGTHRVSKAIFGRNPLRSAKDLGRVLALALLEEREVTERRPQAWLEALERCFPEEWPDLARRAGDGLRALLADPDALEDALFTVNIGLLEALQVTQSQLRALGQQFLSDVIEPLAAAAQRE